jgi:hypothetical protein
MSVVVATAFGAAFVLIDLAAWRMSKRQLPMLGIRAARVVLVFYTGLLGWLLYRAVERVTLGAGPHYPAVLLGIVLAATLIVLACELLMRRSSRELKHPASRPAHPPA